MTLEETIKFWKRAVDHAHMCEDMRSLKEAHMRLAAAEAALEDRQRMPSRLEAALTRLGLP